MNTILSTNTHRGIMMLVTCLFALLPQFCHAQVKVGNMLMSMKAEGDGAVLTVDYRGYREDEISNDARLLIKLSEGTVLKLQGTKGEHAFEVEGQLDQLSTAKIIHLSTASFKLTKAQALSFQKGIAKIRLKTNDDPYEKEFKSDKCGMKLYEEYKNSL